jgi:uncharacterized membrane protein YccC
MDSFCAEISVRFEQIEHMLAGHAPTGIPQASSLTINRSKLVGLTHFQKAAVAVTTSQLKHLEAISRLLFDCARELKGFTGQCSSPPRERDRQVRLVLDPERLSGAVMVMATLWMAFLIWVYFDPPGHQGIVQMAPIFAMGATFAPLAVRKMLLPFALGCAGVGVLYVFIMPRLSGYGEFGFLIFGYTFAVTYLYGRPDQNLPKLGALVPFVVLTSIKNEQSYNFANYLNSTTMLLLSISLVVVTAYIPSSPRPEKVFIRLLNRFFRGAEFLVSRLAVEADGEQKRYRSWRWILSPRDLIELPDKLERCGRQIDHRTFPDNTPEQVQALVASLRSLAYRIQALTDAREKPCPDSWPKESRDAFRAWRMTLAECLRRWADDPAAELAGNVHEMWAAKQDRMEARINEIINQAEKDALSERTYETLYLRLGEFRGVSEALVAHAPLAAGINWEQWREARF